MEVRYYSRKSLHRDKRLGEFGTRAENRSRKQRKATQLNTLECVPHYFHPRMNIWLEWSRGESDGFTFRRNHMDEWLLVCEFHCTRNEFMCVWLGKNRPKLIATCENRRRNKPNSCRWALEAPMLNWIYLNPLLQ